MPRTHRRQRLASALTLVALMVGLGAAATPAQAAPASAYDQCFPIYHQQTWEVIRWVCLPIPVTKHPCPECPDFALGFDHLLNPQDPWYVTDLVWGLTLLAQAAAEPDPQQVTILRSQAEVAFLKTADRYGTGGIALGAVGFADRINHVIEPQPVPWLKDAGTAVVIGITLMQAARATGDPRLVDMAMAEFDAAYGHLSNH